MRITSYIYRADQFCPDCIIGQLRPVKVSSSTVGPVAPGAYMTTEDNLTELAVAFGIDRFDERSYDSGDFPKATFGHDTDEDGNPYQCGNCGEDI